MMMINMNACSPNTNILRKPAVKIIFLDGKNRTSQ